MPDDPTRDPPDATGSRAGHAPHADAAGRSPSADIAELPLPAEASAVLDSWATSEPPAGFVDRVVAVTHPRAAPGATRWRRPRVARIAAAAAVAAAAAASLLLWRGGNAPGTAGRITGDGARVTQDRETIALGARGVAVAEPGSELSWTISPAGAAAIDQTRGDVFYRVEPGGPFVVDTPYGQIMVRGTCFRVEVMQMTVSKQTWIGGAVGAALAATVLITVYEGRIRVVNARGQTDARAGDRVALDAGAAPSRLTTGPGGSIAAVEPPPADSASVAELLRRDQSHRGEIALLRARIRSLETPSAGPEAGVGAAHKQGNKKTFDLSQDELLAMAKACEIRFDIPGYGLEPRLMDARLADAAGLSDADRAIYDQTVGKENESYMATLRGLYQELGGEGGDNLDARSLYTEILHKSPSADYEAARKQLAEERAGLIAPPADALGHKRSVIERMLRLQTTAAGSLEQLLAAQLGADKAHQIRQAGWAGGDDSILYGCPD